MTTSRRLEVFITKPSETTCEITMNIPVGDLGTKVARRVLPRPVTEYYLVLIKLWIQVRLESTPIAIQPTIDSIVILLREMKLVEGN